MVSHVHGGIAAGSIVGSGNFGCAEGGIFHPKDFSYSQGELVQMPRGEGEVEGGFASPVARGCSGAVTSSPSASIRTPASLSPPAIIPFPVCVKFLDLSECGLEELLAVLQRGEAHGFLELHSAGALVVEAKVDCDFANAQVGLHQ